MVCFRAMGTTHAFGTGKDPDWIEQEVSVDPCDPSHVRVKVTGPGGKGPAELTPEQVDNLVRLLTNARVTTHRLAAHPS